MPTPLVSSSANRAAAVSGGRGFPTPDPDEPRGRVVGSIALADGTALKVTVHCVDRFWERAASGCTTFQHALERLQAIAASVGVEAERPAWADRGRPGERWVALGPDVGLVARRSAAVTCLARGVGRPSARRRRRTRRAS